MKTILVAVDGSDSATEALDFAVELCKETGAALEVISVKPKPLVGRGGGGLPVLEVEAVQGAEHIAQTAAEQAVAAGVPAKAHVQHGDPAESIAAAGVELGADLIVVGTRGLGPVSASMLGSVSHALIKKSRIPVTVVRARTHDHAHA